MRDYLNDAHWLLDIGDKAAVWRLIKNGTIDVNASDEDGFPLLHRTLSDEDMVTALIKAGADPNAQVHEMKCIVA